LSAFTIRGIECLTRRISTSRNQVSLNGFTGGVDRPDLNPGTLGGQQGSPPPTTEVHLSWSEVCDRPLHTTEEHLDLLLRLQVWLQSEVGVEGGVILSTGPTGVELRIPW
jgi:hypothetical protein